MTTTCNRILIGAILAGMMGAAQAAPFTWEDIRAFDQPLSEVTPFSYTHSNPFDPSLYDFVSATLTVTLVGQGNNDYFVSFDESSLMSLIKPNFSTMLPSEIFAASWADSYSVALSRTGTNGNPRLTSSVFSVTASARGVAGDLTPVAVPVPGTLALLGAGLLGCALMRRRRPAVRAAAAAA